MDKIINMIVNTVLRRVVQRGVDEGFKYMSKGGKAARRPQAEDAGAPGAPEAQAAQRRAGQDLAKRARDVARLSRRIR